MGRMTSHLVQKIKFLFETTHQFTYNHHQPPKNGLIIQVFIKPQHCWEDYLWCTLKLPQASTRDFHAMSHSNQQYSQIQFFYVSMYTCIYIYVGLYSTILQIRISDIARVFAFQQILPDLGMKKNPWAPQNKASSTLTHRQHTTVGTPFDS